MLVVMTASSQALDKGHFFKSLKGQHVTTENIEQRFDRWFSLPEETEWRIASQRTNQLGMTRVEYRQYVGGVEVEHSQILLHIIDGEVETANGTVMEVEQAPATIRLYRNAPAKDTPTDNLGRKIYLVDSSMGYRYATKQLSGDLLEWIYTDIETGQELMRIPTHHHASAEPVKVKGTGIYCGEVEMDATFDAESNTYNLYDPQRNIRTLNGAAIPSLYQMVDAGTFYDNFPDVTLPYPIDQMTEKQWEEWGNSLDYNNFDLTQYINLNTKYASSKESNFWCNEITEINVKKVSRKDKDGVITELVPSKENPLTFSIEVLYGKNNMGIIHRCIFTAETMPCLIRFEKRHVELPTEGVTLKLRLESNPNKYFNPPTEEQDSELLAEYYLTADESQVKELDQDGIMATITYKPSTWSVVDIHWGMEKTYDYYMDVFKRNSFDGKGAPIINLFYLPDQYSGNEVFLTGILGNAFAMPNPPYPMVYGGGDDVMLSNTIELSVTAHEFTHLITDATSNLEYQGESGALNESFSDIFGINVKKYVKGNDASWEIGEGVCLIEHNMRDMAFPKKSGDGSSMACPDTYQGEYWKDVSNPSQKNDMGGVHTNSGVQNKWYYLLTDGNSGTNDKGFSYDVTGIGIKKAEQIAYLTLTEYATSKAQYADIRLCSHQAAKQLYGDESVEAKTVLDAWDAVGVFGEDNPTTGIETVSLPAQSDNYYDLQGRQVSQPDKGFYVKNGRKIIVK